MPPVQAELELVEPILQTMGGFVKKPNMVLTIYKGRGSRYPKETKIWQHVCLGTMRVTDLFCTDKYYNPITVEKTFVNVLEDDNLEVNKNLKQVDNKLIDENTGEVIEDKKQDIKF